MTTLRREGEIRIHDTTIGVWEEHYNPVVYAGMTKVMLRAVEHLRARGWTMQPDARVAKQYPSLKPDHWEGKHGDLEIKIALHGRHLELKFFQDVVRENPNGGQYGFQQLERMAKVSPALRLQCLAEMWRVVRLCEDIGYVLTEKNGFGEKTIGAATPLLVRDLAELEGARGTPLEIFNRSWGSDRFERDQTGWPSRKEISSCWGQHDRDGKQITQGVTKYMRGRDGRIVRGQVFGGINGNWQLVSNGRTIAWAHCARDFFDCERPDIEPRRVHDQKKRLREELDKALKADNFSRVAVLGAKLAREAA